MKWRRLRDLSHLEVAARIGADWASETLGSTKKSHDAHREIYAALPFQERDYAFT